MLKTKENPSTMSVVTLNQNTPDLQTPPVSGLKMNDNADIANV